MTIEDILTRLPSKADLLNAAGLDNRHTFNGDLLTAIGIFGAGMMLGAGLALLFAPKPGEELRQEIAEKFNEVNRRFSSEGPEQSSSRPLA